MATQEAGGWKIETDKLLYIPVHTKSFCHL